MATAGADGQARIFTTAAIAEGPQRTTPIGEGELFSLAFADDGRLVAGGGDGSIRIVYVEGAPDEQDRTGDQAHKGAVRGLMFGPELVDANDKPKPRRLFSIADDGELRAWFIDNKRKPKSFAMGQAQPRALAWLPPPSKAKAAQQGGHLAIVDRRRRLSIVAIDASGEMTNDHVEVDGRLAKLGKDLKASGDQVRKAAVVALAALDEDDARRILERTLAKDAGPAIRAAAAEALGTTGRRRARPKLREALNDDHETVRAAALQALETLEADAPLAAVRSGLGARYADIRLRCVQKLPELRASSPLVPGLLAERLNDGDRDVRMAAIAGLYALDTKDTIEPTRLAYERGPVDVRQVALERLARAG
ncbi:MAG: HEAT repeat domain-containing protein, partial [Planctomycetota bacterium]